MFWFNQTFPIALAYGVERAQYLCRYACNQRIRLNVTRDDRAGRDDGPATDSNPRQDRGARPDPGAGLDSDCPCSVRSRATLRVAHHVVACHQGNLKSQLDSIADRNRRRPVQAAAGIDEHLIPDCKLEALLDLEPAPDKTALPHHRAVPSQEGGSDAAAPHIVKQQAGDQGIQSLAHKKPLTPRA